MFSGLETQFNSFASRAEKDVEGAAKKAEYPVTAFLAAIWVAPAAAELATGSFTWPLVAAGAAYYFGSDSLLRGYVAGGAVYTYHLIQLEKQAAAYVEKTAKDDYAWLKSTAKTDFASAKAWAKKEGTYLLNPKGYDQETKDDANDFLLAVMSWYQSMQDIDGN